jgi:hypothetical protein
MIERKEIMNDWNYSANYILTLFLFLDLKNVMFHAVLQSTPIKTYSVVLSSQKKYL